MVRTWMRIARLARSEVVLVGSARPESGAEHAHPCDLSVSLGVVRLLLDYKASIWVADVESKGDTLAIGKRVRIERRHFLDLVGILEPLTQHQLQNRIRPGRLPTSTWRQSAEIDLWIENGDRKSVV